MKLPPFIVSDQLFISYLRQPKKIYKIFSFPARSITHHFRRELLDRLEKTFC